MDKWAKICNLFWKWDCEPTRISPVETQNSALDPSAIPNRKKGTEEYV
jgi:hypothetical protein